MSEVIKGTWVVLVLGALLASAGGSLAADRTAGAILKDIDRVKMPAIDATRSGDEAYVKELQSQRRTAIAKKAALILELYNADPDHQRIPVLMAERWGSMSAVGAEGDQLKQE